MAGLVIADFGDWWWISRPSFVLGMIVATYECAFRKILATHTLGVVTSILTAMLIGLVNGHYKLIPEFITLLLIPNLMPLLVIVLIYAYGSTQNIIANYLGKISLEIYLIHGLAIAAIHQFDLPWFTFTICVFILTIPFAAIAHKLGNMISSHL
jgi:peptidoglycan/LPS O-acetylase OafA/YrhL